MYDDTMDNFDGTLSSKPIWFLDIDGVINAYDHNINKTKNNDDWCYQEFNYQDDEYGLEMTLPIIWRKSLINFINEIHRNGRAEIHWLTTWGKTARTQFAPLVGLDDFAITYEQPRGIKGSDPYSRDLDWWKMDVLFKHSNNRPFIFSDDDLSKPTRRHIHSHFDKDNVLLITPFPSKGLEEEHLVRITDFLNKHNHNNQ